MGVEIERKYLVDQVAWQAYKADNSCVGQKYCQGYIPTSNGTTVRLRIVGDQGFLTIKSKSVEYARAEYEYSIPAPDAQEMLNDLCLQPAIEKYRYKIKLDNLIWEVDEFLRANAGLIIAEVELEQVEQKIILPHWIDREVSDRKYFNSYLVKHPYSQWSEQDRR